MQTILAKQTTAATTDVITAMRNIPMVDRSPITFYLLGALDSDEEIKFQYLDGDTWRDSKKSITAAAPVVALYGPLEFRLSKEITDAAAGVGVSTVAYDL